MIPCEHLSQGSEKKSDTSETQKRKRRKSLFHYNQRLGRTVAGNCNTLIYICLISSCCFQSFHFSCEDQVSEGYDHRKNTATAQHSNKLMLIEVFMSDSWKRPCCIQHPLATRLIISFRPNHRSYHSIDRLTCSATAAPELVPGLQQQQQN